MRDITASKISFADDLEQTLSLGEAWFADLRVQMDAYVRAPHWTFQKSRPPSHH